MSGLGVLVVVVLNCQAYLCSTAEDVVSAKSAFRSKYLDELDQALQVCRSTLQEIQARRSIQAVLCAGRDEKQLALCRTTCDDIKQQAALAWSTSIKLDTSATKETVERVEQLIRDTHKRHAESENLQKHLQNEESLMTRLQPFDCSSRLSECRTAYLYGSNMHALRELDQWLAYGSQPRLALPPLQGSPLLFEESKQESLTRFDVKATGPRDSPHSALSQLSAMAYSEFMAAEVVGIHFCQKSLPDSCSASRIIKNIAFQLAQRLPQYKQILCQQIPAVFGSAGGQEPHPASL